MKAILGKFLRYIYIKYRSKFLLDIKWVIVVLQYYYIMSDFTMRVKFYTIKLDFFQLLKSILIKDIDTFLSVSTFIMQQIAI